MNDLDLSAFFTTKSQAIDFSTRLSEIKDDIYETGFNLDQLLIDQLGVQRRDKFLSLLRENQVNVGSNTSLKKFFEDILRTVASLPVATLTLAFEPRSANLVAITEWFVSNLHTQVLLDIEVDPGLVAGAVVTFNGKSQDFSIRPQVDRIFTQITAGTAGLSQTGSHP